MTHKGRLWSVLFLDERLPISEICVQSCILCLSEVVDKLIYSPKVVRILLGRVVEFVIIHTEKQLAVLRIGEE